jgi:hypothetical protein
MRTLRASLLVVALVTLSMAGSLARADGIGYTIDGNFSPSTVGSFTFAFTSPSNSLDSTLSFAAPIDFTMTSGMVTTAIKADGSVSLFPASQNGLLDIEFSSGGIGYLFEFFGNTTTSQMYSGTNAPFPLLTGTFGTEPGLSDAIIASQVFGLDATIVATSAPEPSSLILLAAGLLSIPFIRRAARLC